MKASIYILFILGLKTTLFAQNCEKSYEQLVSTMKAYDKEVLYQSFTIQTIDQDGTTEPIFNEVWDSPTITQYKNPYITICQDLKVQIVISESNRQILIRDNPKTKTNYGLSTQSYLIPYDSIVGLGYQFECEKLNNGRLSLSMVLFIDGQSKEKVKIIFNPEKKRLISGEIIAYRNGKDATKTLYIYKAYSTTNKIPFSKALDLIYTKGVLYPKYKSFEVSDLRGINSDK